MLIPSDRDEVGHGSSRPSLGQPTDLESLRRLAPWGQSVFLCAGSGFSVLFH